MGRIVGGLRKTRLDAGPGLIEAPIPQIGFGQQVAHDDTLLRIERRVSL
jgi:hypothetical protein